MVINTTKTINGKEYDYHISDKGTMIERDGVQYSEAIDPLGSNREYTETDIPIESDEATEQDYIEALNKLGVKEEVDIDGNT